MRLTSADREIIMAMIDATATRDRDDSERFAMIFRAALTRFGIDHAARLEVIALYVNERRAASEG